MRLLFITRKVDRDDSRVGFVHGWLNQLNQEIQLADTRRFNADQRRLIVLCQEKGDTTGLVGDIEVFSMGKECGAGKFRQLWEFKKFMWIRRKEYDVVFVHMMPIYAIAAGLLCKIFNKPLYLWYVHKSVDWRLRLTKLFVKGYFTASKDSFRMKTGKPVHVVGHGIDTDKFRQQTTENRQQRTKKISLLTVGRISPVKNIHLMIDAAKVLLEQGREVRLTIVGEPALEKDREYYLKIQDSARKENNNIVFVGAKNQDEVIPYYQSSDIFLNLSETGSLDKSVLEAMACGCLVFTSNEAFHTMLRIFPEGYAKDLDIGQLVQKIGTLMSLSEDRRGEVTKQFRDLVIQHHSLEGLMRKITSHLHHPELIEGFYGSTSSS